MACAVQGGITLPRFCLGVSRYPCSGRSRGNGGTPVPGPDWGTPFSPCRIWDRTIGGTGGIPLPPRKEPGTRSWYHLWRPRGTPSPLWTDTHSWKHNPRRTTFADGENYPEAKTLLPVRFVLWRWKLFFINSECLCHQFWLISSSLWKMHKVQHLA